MATLNPMRADPQRLGLERRQFTAEMNRYLNELMQANRQLLVVEDAFGLIPRKDDLFLFNTDCGTGAGGFKPSNTCASGGGGSKQTDSKSFKKWFGKSKVVDEDGNPLVVYHGTNADFEEFRNTGIGEFGPAIYFSDVPDEAAEYADRDLMPGANIKPVYLKMLNPFVGSAEEFWEEFSDGVDDADTIEQAEKKGYDGIISKRERMYYSSQQFKFIYTGEYSTHYVVFQGSQVKSATGNKGTFDESADVRNELIINTRWKFLTSDEKLDQYRRWLKSQFKEGLLKEVGGKPWTSKHIESAYRKGVLRSFLEVNPEAMEESIDFAFGRRSQFLATAFGSPQSASKIRLLGTRTFDQLEGFTPDMGKKLNRIMADAIANGRNARTVARDIVKQIGLERYRALRIARTEMANAYAEGQLDSFEQMGVRELVVMAEWMTTGDPCPMCAPMDGVVLTIEEARGLIPRHPNCKCAWGPANVGEFERKRKTHQSQIQKAIERSLQAEWPNAKSLKIARLASRWTGADRKIADRKRVRKALRDKFKLGR